MTIVSALFVHDVFFKVFAHYVLLHPNSIFELFWCFRLEAKLVTHRSHGYDYCRIVLPYARYRNICGAGDQHRVKRSTEFANTELPVSQGGRANKILPSAAVVSALTHRAAWYAKHYLCFATLALHQQYSRETTRYKNRILSKNSHGRGYFLGDGGGRGLMFLKSHVDRHGISVIH